MSIFKKTPVIVLVTALVSCTGTFFFSKQYFSSNRPLFLGSSSPNHSPQASNCSLKIKRLKGFHYIQPLLYAEPEDESIIFSPLKSQLLGLIESFKNSGSITSASIYLRAFEKASWMSINPNETFHPGSLMKVPLLITYLKMEESNPGVLNKKFILAQRPAGFPEQIYTAKQIETGKAYTVTELLKYMIQYSDNYATFLLHENVDKSMYNSTYTSIGLPIPNIYDRNFSISASAYSTFFKVLFNAAFLSFEHSEFAMELLSKSEFSHGFEAGFPAGTPMVHKFGEWGDGQGVDQLHESGLVYINGAPYLLTIMTSGKDSKKLPDVIAGISQMIYNNLSKNFNTSGSYSMTKSRNLSDKGNM